MIKKEIQDLVQRYNTEDAAVLRTVQSSQETRIIQLRSLFICVGMNSDTPKAKTVAYTKQMNKTKIYSS